MERAHNSCDTMIHDYSERLLRFFIFCVSFTKHCVLFTNSFRIVIYKYTMSAVFKVEYTTK